MSKEFCIYCLTLKSDGRKYIGITGQRPRDRWSYGHGYDVRTYIGATIRKYGWEAFVHDILETGLTEDVAKQKEQEYIKKYVTMNRSKGFNLTAGGDGVTGYKFSEEGKQKLRASHLGYVMPQEQKDKISFGLKQYYKTHTVNVPYSQIIKMVKAREGMTAWNKGKALGEDVRQKLRDANLGKRASMETRKKMSDSQKKRSVATLDDNGDILCVYRSVREAASALGAKSCSHIVECCQGKRKTFLKLKWCYYE